MSRFFRLVPGVPPSLDKLSLAMFLLLVSEHSLTQIPLRSWGPIVRCCQHPSCGLLVKKPSYPTGSKALVRTVNVPPDTVPSLQKGKAPARAKKGACVCLLSISPVGKKGAGKKAAGKPAEPMATRSGDASRAGGLRSGVGGSGKTDTYYYPKRKTK
jgi:hypothetical protein